jgi:hypothetical protein
MNLIRVHLHDNTENLGKKPDNAVFPIYRGWGYRVNRLTILTSDAIYMKDAYVDMRYARRCTWSPYYESK